MAWQVAVQDLVGALELMNVEQGAADGGRRWPRRRLTPEKQGGFGPGGGNPLGGPPLGRDPLGGGGRGLVPSGLCDGCLVVVTWQMLLCLVSYLAFIVVWGG